MPRIHSQGHLERSDEILHDEGVINIILAFIVATHQNQFGALAAK